MLRSATLKLVPLVTLVCFVPSTALATTLTTYPFNATYDVVVTAQDITPNLEQTLISGTSTDAPYGLTNVNGLAYSQTNFTTGGFSSNTDPTTFGLQGYEWHNGKNQMCKHLLKRLKAIPGRFCKAFGQGVLE